MRIHGMVRLLVGLVFLATLPTGSAQPKGGACTKDSNCSVGSCCKADLTCSRIVAGTIAGGRSADDPCECISQVYDTPTGQCGCTTDSHCEGTRCCTPNGTCSTRGVSTVLPGRIASDACECTSGEITKSSGRCACKNAKLDCEKNKCCRADDLCSTRDQASVLAGTGAADACECASGKFNAVTGKCGCVDDSHCPGSKCCTPASTCSKKPGGSVAAGKIPTDVCECGSGAIIPSTGKCKCIDDADCEGDKCCGANGVCSRRDKASVLTGKQANAACECAEGRYDANTNRCGCTADSHCADDTCCKADFTCSSVDGASILSGKGPAEDACECITGEYDEAKKKCVCTKNSDCEGDTCCKADQTCSEKDVSSVLPAGIASDACECSTNLYSPEAGECLCRNDGDCAGDTCCGDNNTCSVEDEGSVAAGADVTDECECIRNGGYQPGRTPGTGVCGCTDASHCPQNKCCTKTGSCSNNDLDSVVLGGKASDACECVTKAFNPDTGRCVCGDDNHCPEGMCCKGDGKCSARAKASVTAGFITADVCECASGATAPDAPPDKVRCGCNDDIQCPENRCCMEDGRCSARDKETVSPGVIADDKCECSSLSYDSSRQVCGCTKTKDCATDAGEVCSETTLTCVLVKSSRAADAVEGPLGNTFPVDGSEKTPKD